MLSSGIGAGREFSFATSNILQFIWSALTNALPFTYSHPIRKGGGGGLFFRQDDFSALLARCEIERRRQRARERPALGDIESAGDPEFGEGRVGEADRRRSGLVRGVDDGAERQVVGIE